MNHWLETGWQQRAGTADCNGERYQLHAKGRFAKDIPGKLGFAGFL